MICLRSLSPEDRLGYYTWLAKQEHTIHIKHPLVCDGPLIPIMRYYIDLREEVMEWYKNVKEKEELYVVHGHGIVSLKTTIVHISNGNVFHPPHSPAQMLLFHQWQKNLADYSKLMGLDTPKFETIRLGRIQRFSDKEFRKRAKGPASIPEALELLPHFKGSWADFRLKHSQLEDDEGDETGKWNPHTTELHTSSSSSLSGPFEFKLLFPYRAEVWEPLHPDCFP